MRILGLFIAALCTCASFGQRTDFVEDEILVKFSPGYELAGAAAVKYIGGTVIRDLRQIGVKQVKLNGLGKVNAALKSLKQFSFVQYAEPNAKKELHFVPNDPRYGQQWGPKKVRAEQAWDVTFGDPAVVVAVIDTGTQLNHEDLVNKLVAGFDFSDNDNDPSDYQGHGTHTAGIVGASTNNGVGVVGVGFNCKVMPLKIFPNATAANSAAAIMYAVDNGCKVISMSYGSGFPSNTERDAVDYAWNNGAVLLASSGNAGNQNKNYPAAFDNCIAVGSTDPDDSRSGFSTWGDWVDVAAPGSNYVSTILGGGYVAESGTSMSCPCAAGVTALVWANAPAGTTNAEIRDAIESTCDNVGNWVAHGRVNAEKALQSSVIAPPVEEGAIDVEMIIGQGSDGTVQDVHYNDGIGFTVKSTIQNNVGQVGSAAATFQMTEFASGYRYFAVKATASGPVGSTGMIYLFNYVTGQWDFVKAIALKPSGTSINHQIRSDFSPYISTLNKQARVAIRGLNPYRRTSVGPRPTPAQFNLVADLIQLVVRLK